MTFRPWCLCASAAVLFGLLPLSAAPMTEDLAAFATCKTYGGLSCFNYMGWQVAALADVQGTPALLLLTTGDKVSVHPVKTAAHTLTSRLGMRNAEDIPLSGGGLAVINPRLRDQEESDSALGGTPAQAVLYLLHRGYYHIDSLTSDGRLVLKSGKKKSIDLKLPLTTPTAEVAELMVGVNMDTFAANVLAEKLGYPADSSSPQDKEKIKGETKAKDVFYYHRSKKKDASGVKRVYALISRRGNVYAFGTKEGLAATAEAPALQYPEHTATPDKPQTTAPAPQQPADADKAGDSPKVLTPKDALKEYIRKLKEL